MGVVSIGERMGGSRRDVLKSRYDNGDTVSQELLALEGSKYALRVILLLDRDGMARATQGWLLRRIPTSKSTGLRCLQVLESNGLLASRKRSEGRREREYWLTASGKQLSRQRPRDWSRPVRFP